MSFFFDSLFSIIFFLNKSRFWLLKRKTLTKKKEFTIEKDFKNDIKKERDKILSLTKEFTIEKDFENDMKNEIKKKRDKIISSNLRRLKRGPSI